MVGQPLVDRKIEVSAELTKQLADSGAPLLAAYWEWRDEKGRWELLLIPTSRESERKLIDAASDKLVEPRYRSTFSLSDVLIDARQIDRARVIGSFIRGPEDFGRQFDTTFTGGHYFEGIIVVYLAPQLVRQHHVA